MQARELSIGQARALWLERQGLSGPSLGGPLEAMKRIGYVQIDTIHVVERAHHHVLWTRVPDYRPSDLRRLQTEERSVFEGWTHALSYIPVDDFGFFVRGMRQFERRPGRWYADVTPADRRRLLKRIRDEGPLSIRDIDEEKREKDHEWASRKPSKRALEMLFHSGRLAVSARDGMVKSYELIERHFGWQKRPAPVTAGEEARYVLERALRAQGLVTLESVIHLEREYREKVRKLLKGLEPVKVAGVKGEFYARPEALEAIPPSPGEGVHVLSPFDPLVIQRKRAKALFGFDYTLECYVPAPKRKWGYFVLPVLVGDEFVARIDAKADREKRKLLIKAWHWEKGAKDRRGLRARIEDKLDAYERFCVSARPALTKTPLNRGVSEA